MNKEDIEKSLREMNKLILEGKAIEAFEKYYHEDVEIQENDLAPTLTKNANRKREIEFFSQITELRKAEILGQAIGDNISAVLWDYDYSHEDRAVKKFTQVAVQHWSDGKIIKEIFIYYN
jgi:hypothetical protein